MDSRLPPNWGLCPSIGPVPTYSLFVFLGLIAGLLVFFWLASKDGKLDDKLPVVFIGALVGGVVGAKLPYWIQGGAENLFGGRTVIGGVIGGVLGAIISRRAVGLKQPMGNYFAPALSLGYAIGRIGCMCGGCCYGVPTHSAWGIDLGDHVLRWPTQAVESLFGFALFAYLMWRRKHNVEPGALFQEFILLFFGFRLGIEFLRASSAYAFGLSQAQWVSLAAIAAYLGMAMAKNKTRLSLAPVNEHET